MVREVDRRLVVSAVLGPQSVRLGGFEGRERSSSSGGSSSRVVLLRAARGVQPGVPAGHHPPALTAPPSSDAKFHLVFSPCTTQGKLGAINCLPNL